MRVFETTLIKRMAVFGAALLLDAGCTLVHLFEGVYSDIVQSYTWRHLNWN